MMRTSDRKTFRAALLALALLAPISAEAQDEGEQPPAAPVPQTVPGAPGQPTVSTPAPTPAPPASTQPPPLGAEPEAPGGTTVEEQPDGSVVVGPTRPKLPNIGGAGKVRLDFVDTTLWELVLYFARIREMNFILADQKELQGKKVTIISHKDVSVDAAYEAFLSAMSVSGYTIVESGGMNRVVKTQEAAASPIPVGKGSPGRATEGYVTQLIQLDNVSVAEVNKIITSLMPPEAKVVAYQPTNTLIITDTANNLRKIFSILQELDVAAPKSTMEIVPIRFASAADLKAIIEELYGTADQTTAAAPAGRTSRTSRTSTSSRRTLSRDSAGGAEGGGGGGDSVTAGEESRFISKVIEDERTNALIVLANAEGHEAVRSIVAELDKDVDPQNRAQIHVIYLEHAKAEEAAQVLAELSQDSRRGRGSTTTPRPGLPSNPGIPRLPGADADAPGGPEGESSAIAAFDSGMRIAADENTNSLVIIANQEDFKVVASVVEKLDIERKQVFVDAVILELASDDANELGLAAHMPVQPSKDAVGFVGGQFGTQSLGVTQDLLTGLAVGVFGESVEVPLADGSVLPIPAFGIVLNALKTNASTNIVSNPAILTLDNQEAEIVVGRRIPFPTTAGLNNLGQPVVSFQREDVAITLKVTPRVNSSNYVTLEVELEVQEIEEDDQGLNVQQAGFITSKREEKTTVLIKDNQTVVLGGLVGTTDTEVETKVPVLGDLPVVGVLFRGTRKQSRKTNLMIFLTPHIIDDTEDMLEIQRVKDAQRQEFMRRFYGRSKDEYIAELRNLLRYSMNYVDQPSMFRGPAQISKDLQLDDEPVRDETVSRMEDLIESTTVTEPGAGAGEPGADGIEILDEPAGGN